MTAIEMVAVVVRSYVNNCMLGGGICGVGNDGGVTKKSHYWTWTMDYVGFLVHIIWENNMLLLNVPHFGSGDL